MVAWFASEEEVIVAKSDFITIVAEEYRYPCVAKICGIMAYLKMIDNILFKYPNILRKIKLGVGSDCQAVIDNLWNNNPITSISKHLHQFIREIKLVVR